jgi:hypothetical protein
MWKNNDSYLSSPISARCPFVDLLRPSKINSIWTSISRDSATRAMDKA